MKVGLYSPFLTDNLGGGERYLLSVAECLLPNHQVDLIVSRLDPKLVQKFSCHFNLNLTNLNMVTGPFSSYHSSWERAKFTQGYDIFYYMTDGSFFIPRAKLNAVHFMIPLNRQPSFWERFKLNFWQIKTANSFFTQRYLEQVWKIKIDYVHWGAVDSSQFKPGKKQNLILNVGRFFSPKGNKHCKRQDFLVKTFKKMCQQGLRGWRLILNGPVDNGLDNLRYFNYVKKLALGYPIAFHNRSSFVKLQSDYSRAKIYWHATGYGLNQALNPQAMEHLGLSTVEAMSAGAVPVVINQGGQPEIVSHAVNGLLWSTQKQLINQTQVLINNQNLLLKLSRRARLRAKDFSKSNFCQLTNKIFKL